MKYFFKRSKKPPFSSKIVVRVLLVVIFILSITAGYFQAQYKAMTKKYLRLEDKYVRVRGELGIEETQRLIDKSHAN